MALRTAIVCIPRISNLIKLAPIRNNIFKSNNISCTVNCSCQLLNKKAFSRMSGDNKDVVYEDVKSATQNNSIYIIDVREPQELKDSGLIPNSINIPLGEVTDALGLLSDDKFKEKYGKPKPNHDTPIIFSCRSGKRATAADEQAVKLGFMNTKIYKGSWMDWENHENQ